MASTFGQPQECRNSCGQLIYFDRNSEKGHPSSDKWIPLQYDKESGIKTDEPHNCPKSPFYVKGQQQPQQHQVQIQMTRQEQTDLMLQVKLLTQKVDRIVTLLEKVQTPNLTNNKESVSN